MKALKVNITRLKTVNGYASDKGISTTEVYRMIKAGKIESFKVDKLTLIIV